MEEVQSVVLETNELECQKQPQANASFGIFSESSFRWEQKKNNVLPFQSI